MFDYPFETFTRAIGDMRRMRRAARTMAALDRLDDRTLHDIGIHRAQIPGVALDLADNPNLEVRRRA